uniref:Uncharacterized protein n=1 Tax=Arundo donax TaxID=35708 RepID=A0A0A9DJF9_ARUDO
MELIEFGNLRSFPWQWWECRGFSNFFIKWTCPELGDLGQHFFL